MLARSSMLDELLTGTGVFVPVYSRLRGQTPLRAQSGSRRQMVITYENGLLVDADQLITFMHASTDRDLMHSETESALARRFHAIHGHSGSTEDLSAYAAGSSWRAHSSQQRFKRALGMRSVGLVA